MIRRYVRVPDGNRSATGGPSRGRPVGIVIGHRPNNTGRIYFGFSRCSPVDTFDTVNGDEIAFGRLNSCEFWFDPDTDSFSSSLCREMYSAFNDIIPEIEWVIEEIVEHPERACRMPKHVETP